MNTTLGPDKRKKHGTTAEGVLRLAAQLCDVARAVERTQAQANLDDLSRLHAEAWGKAAAKRMREVAELPEAEGIAPSLREKARALELVMNLSAVQQPLHATPPVNAA